MAHGGTQNAVASVPPSSEQRENTNNNSSNSNSGYSYSYSYNYSYNYKLKKNLNKRNKKKFIIIRKISKYIKIKQELSSTIQQKLLYKI